MNAKFDFTPMPYIALPAFFRKMLTYRLHQIRITRAKNNGVIATIYDGDAVIHTVQDSGREEAIRRAKEWIDEQDEVAPQFDLHAEAHAA